MKYKLILLLTILTLTIQSCQPSDIEIKNEIENFINSEVELDGIKIGVSNGIVVLSGELENNEDKINVESLARKAKGVESITNNIQVRPQPKCLDEDTIALLKKIYAEKIRDTSEISVTNVRTLSRNKEFQSCDCAAKVEAEGRRASLWYLYPINESSEYTVQYDDAESTISVTVK